MNCDAWRSSSQSEPLCWFRTSDDRSNEASAFRARRVRWLLASSHEPAWSAHAWRATTGWIQATLGRTTTRNSYEMPWHSCEFIHMNFVWCSYEILWKACPWIWIAIVSSDWGFRWGGRSCMHARIYDHNIQCKRVDAVYVLYSIMWWHCLHMLQLGRLHGYVVFCQPEAERMTSRIRN